MRAPVQQPIVAAPQLQDPFGGSCHLAHIRPQMPAYLPAFLLAAVLARARELLGVEVDVNAAWLIAEAIQHGLGPAQDWTDYNQRHRCAVVSLVFCTQWARLCRVLHPVGAVVPCFAPSGRGCAVFCTQWALLCCCLQPVCAVVLLFAASLLLLCPALHPGCCCRLGACLQLGAAMPCQSG